MIDGLVILQGERTLIIARWAAAYYEVGVAENERTTVTRFTRSLHKSYTLPTKCVRSIKKEMP